MYTLHCFTLKAFTKVLNIITYIASVSIIWSFPTIYNKQWANMTLVKCGSKKHCSFGVSHFPTYIAQLLHILITLLGLLDLFLTLVQTMCSAWASKDNAMLRQSDRKCLKSFLAGTGENQRDFKGVSQKQADAVAPCCAPSNTGTHRQTHMRTRRQHMVRLPHTYNRMQHSQREYEVKHKHK